MSSWNSVLKDVLFFSARSTHSSPSTLRRVFMPRSYAFAIAPSSGKIGREPLEELAGCRVEGRLRFFAVALDVLTHAPCIHNERCRDGVEEIEAGAQRAGDLRHEGQLRLPSAQRALVLANAARIQRGHEAGNACGGGQGVDARHGIAFVRHR